MSLVCLHRRRKMRSRLCTMEGPDDGHEQPPQGLIREGEEDAPELMKKRLEAPQEEKDQKKSVCGSWSKKKLLHLLGVMEGEVQVTADTDQNLQGSTALRRHLVVKHEGVCWCSPGQRRHHHPAEVQQDRTGHPGSPLRFLGPRQTPAGPAERRTPDRWAPKHPRRVRGAHG